MIYPRFSCISELEKYDELFEADKQDFTYEKIKFKKIEKDHGAPVSSSNGVAQPQPAAKAGEPRERPVEVLNDDGDFVPAKPTPPPQPTQTGPPAADEKPIDILKSFYNDFKGYVPTKDKKEEEKPKESIVNKARSFFGF